MTQPLHTMLQRTGMLTPQHLELSVRQAKARNVSLLDLLVLDRQIPEEALADAFSQWLNAPRVRLDSVRIDAVAVSVVPERLVRLYTCLPLTLSGKDLVLAMANPLDHDAIRDIQFASNCFVKPVVSCRTEILHAIDAYYSPRDARAPEAPPRFDIDTFTEIAGERGGLDLDSADAMTSSGGAPAVDMCNLIVRDAITLKASDIHIEPGADEVRIRLRVDGVLREHFTIPRWMHTALVSRLKILAALDIAQQRMPQDGRIKVTCNKCRSDLRVSTLPTHFGEKVVLRLLGSSSIPTFEALGLSPDEVSLLADAVGQPQGLILVTGPTGAGKSTTLYSMLARRQSTGVNVVTIEDPIEYQVAGISQVQVDEKSGLTFATSLRAVLRQDPDVILVGEIRDHEAAEVALQAALTGHLVLTTLHTNSAVAAIDRLLDLGVRPLLITSAISVVIAQRLVRRICAGCRIAYRPAADAVRKLQLDAGEDFYRGAGCTKCGGTGYSGRVGIFEILRLTPSLKDLIRRQATEGEIATAARASGTRFLLDDAKRKVRAGSTTVEEVMRVMRFERTDNWAPPSVITSPDHRVGTSDRRSGADTSERRSGGDRRQRMTLQ